MLKLIPELADIMKRSKILHCEYEYSNHENKTTKKVKLTLDPSSLYQQEEQGIAQPKEEFTQSDDYDEFLFKKKELNEAKIKAEIENM